jgi:hypothetical protein
MITEVWQDHNDAKRQTSISLFPSWYVFTELVCLLISDLPFPSRQSTVSTHFPLVISVSSTCRWSPCHEPPGISPTCLSCILKFQTRWWGRQTYCMIGCGVFFSHSGSYMCLIRFPQYLLMAKAVYSVKGLSLIICSGNSSTRCVYFLWDTLW